MPCIVVTCEEKYGKYVVSVNMDGKIRTVNFSQRWEAQNLVKRLSVYGKLRGNKDWENTLRIKSTLRKAGYVA